MFIDEDSRGLYSLNDLTEEDLSLVMYGLYLVSVPGDKFLFHPQNSKETQAKAEVLYKQIRCHRIAPVAHKMAEGGVNPSPPGRVSSVGSSEKCNFVGD